VTRIRLILTAIGFAILMATCCRAVEPWADSRLAITNGLLLWLDVSRQNAARGAAGLPPLQSWNDAPDLLLDGSGHHRDVAQPVLTARPRFRQEFNGAMLSFDGQDDFLASIAPGSLLTNVTVLVVAAPRTNGGYRALFSFNATGRNDYTSGLNLDFGSVPGPALARVNSEGAGFSGEFNLLAAPQPLSRWRVFTLIAGRGADGVKLFVDGRSQTSRDRAGDSVLRADELTLGARRYSNTPDRPHVQGFFAGELTEMLLFERALADNERESVERYLDAKYGALLHGIGGLPVREGAVPLVTVTNAPQVQIFYPGFEARALPVDINNVNNIRYRADDKLVAVGYDGRIWLLSDSDGDGLEDKVEPFWDKQTIRAPIGAALTPPGYSRGHGVFVAAKEKVALIVDKDGDDRADEEITVATWTERSEQQGVDALGIAVAPDGSVYFSLGAASFTEAYRVDKATGQARYRTSSERGTVQRVSPDFTKRETVCTGIRFAVGMAFNRLGDLFVTDQEGATWLPNGNPFDELLHIQAGRHYGFPPRHPRHLPDVIDEPSLFDYTPQHQSTCGLTFNEPIKTLLARSDGTRSAREGAAGRSFGPTNWAGDAIVSGYSRGKLWRTKLVKTAAGYVAQTHLLATLQALTVDACVSPAGDLIVATHSGQPDWGSGPNGKGKLWRIRYHDPQAPQPVAAWNSNPTEVKIAFDKPLDPASLKDLAKAARIESGRFVSAGDRFETIRPGYQVVYDQLAAPRYSHEVLSSQLSPDHRTLTLVTRPRAAAVNYAVTFPAVAADGSPGIASSADSAVDEDRPHSHKRNEIDLLTDLTGVEARWESSDGQESWAGWLPHVDLQAAGAFTGGSAEHEQFFRLLTKPGLLTVRGQMNLFEMLQPAIQPGAVLDYERPPEEVTVSFEASAPFTALIGEQSASSSQISGSEHRLLQTFHGPGSRWQPFQLRLSSGRDTALTVSWSTASDPRPRPFPLRRFLVPWAQPPDLSLPPPGERRIPEIAGGRWLRGKAQFFGDKLACGKCHAIRGEGSHVGPDLSNLVYRDYASVRKDIEFPNAAINPDHVASILELANGETLTGIIQREADGVLAVVDGTAVTRQLPRIGLKSVKPSTVSLMPEGLWAGVTDEERRDLMSFLLTTPLEPWPVPPEVQGHAAPAARRRAEFETSLASTFASRTPLTGAAGTNRNGPTPEGGPAAMKIVLCAAAKDAGHGAPGFHDYPLWRERWSKLLSLAEGVKVETADRWPDAEQWKTADVVAFYHDNPAWSGDKAAELDVFLTRGGGLVFLHWSMNASRDVQALAARLGRAWGPGARFRHGPEELRFQPHEITAGFEHAKLVDESYWNLTGNFEDSSVLATGMEEGEPQPQVWARTQGRGRVFVCIPGHFTWTFDDPLYRVLLLRGLCWAAHQPVDRLVELSTVGARLSE
jgi:putative heme-binding domain-containing protein